MYSEKRQPRMFLRDSCEGDILVIKGEMLYGNS